MLARIKKNDKVAVISGKDVGKQGIVLSVSDSTNTVIVQGINIITKHVKARKQGQKSEIKHIESAVNMSNVMLVCAMCQKPSRINSLVLVPSEGRVRVCNRCKQAI